MRRIGEGPLAVRVSELAVAEVCRLTERISAAWAGSKSKEQLAPQAATSLFIENALPIGLAFGQAGVEEDCINLQPGRPPAGGDLRLVGTQLLVINVLLCPLTRLDI